MQTITLSFDVEEFDLPIENGRNIDLETQLSVSTEGLEAILQLLQKHNILCTFYVTANFAIHRSNIIKQIVEHGHEIASHDYSHAPDAMHEPLKSKQILENITGVQIVGYRAPRLANISSQELIDAGYLYNSSINPTWIPGRYNHLKAARSVSKNEQLIIYPTSVSYPLRIPLFWLSLHIMPLTIYKILCSSALKQDEHLNLYFHPWEFSTQLQKHDFGVPNYITHCSGTKLQHKFEKLLIWFKNKKCEFHTTRKYLKINA